MDIVRILESVGLSELESKIYYVLFNTGSTPVGRIIKKAGLHRGTAYQIINRLIKKGLVKKTIKDSMSYYEAEDPRVLIEIINAKKKQLNTILPKLIGKKQFSKQDQEIQVYSWARGMKSVCERILRELDEKDYLCSFGAEGSFGKIVGNYATTWNERLTNKKIKIKRILNRSLKNKVPTYFKAAKGLYKINKDEFPTPIGTLIYKDTVVLFVWNGNPPIAILIKNEENAKGYKNQFDLMWSDSEKIKIN
ncbi:hypothetical protein HOK51_00535 [Candidatus Woesearchaeota archaeon]|jgi:sugar-specific transcriptional regulator TrmB|nr:hypothetical protein [Candidatus Woesearchaeota archaeon]MBT6518300.1 hypothetical protein [Candidatus Woesearchaeota archaeon]MBT7367083.1 hypothetical protein [Candidatus Woesearchaeota archaeon]